MNREVMRKRLQNLVRYYYDRGNICAAEELGQKLKALPIGGMLPEIDGALIAHCSQWHPVVELPWTCPTCGWMWEKIERPIHCVNGRTSGGGGAHEPRVYTSVEAKDPVSRMLRER